jgi:hypothetical protein
MYVKHPHGSHRSVGTDDPGHFCAGSVERCGGLVYLVAPAVYTNLLLLHPTPAERYPAPVRLSLVGILLVIAVGMVGGGAAMALAVLALAPRLWCRSPGHSGHDPPAAGRPSQRVPALVQSVADRCGSAGDRVGRLDDSPLAAPGRLGDGEEAHTPIGGRVPCRAAVRGGQKHAPERSVNHCNSGPPH